MSGTAASPSPLKDKGRKSGKEMDMGLVLGDTGLQGVTVTDDDLADLVKDLGLEGDEASDLLKGLLPEVKTCGQGSEKKENSNDDVDVVKDAKAEVPEDGNMKGSESQTEVVPA